MVAEHLLRLSNSQTLVAMGLKGARCALIRCDAQRCSVINQHAWTEFARPTSCRRTPLDTNERVRPHLALPKCLVDVGEYHRLYQDCTLSPYWMDRGFVKLKSTGIGEARAHPASPLPLSQVVLSQELQRVHWFLAVCWKLVPANS